MLSTRINCYSDRDDRFIAPTAVINHSAPVKRDFLGRRKIERLRLIPPLPRYGCNRTPPRMLWGNEKMRVLPTVSRRPVVRSFIRRPSKSLANNTDSPSAPPPDPNSHKDSRKLWTNAGARQTHYPADVVIKRIGTGGRKFLKYPR